MKYLLLLFILFFSSCSTIKYVTIPLTTPPKTYKPNIIYREKDLMNEYKRSLMKITEWQNWYNVQLVSNFSKKK